METVKTVEWPQTAGYLATKLKPNHAWNAQRILVKEKFHKNRTKKYTTCDFKKINLISLLEYIQKITVVNGWKIQQKNKSPI